MMWMIVSYTTFAQENKPQIPTGSTLAAYCEFGNKGIKYAVLAFTDKSSRSYVVVERSELNIAPGKSVLATGIINVNEINAIITSASARFDSLINKYSKFGLNEKNTKYYASSGMAMVKNMSEFKDSIKSKTGKGLYIVDINEEAKYTVAGTVPYEKILVAIVLDLGSGNSKGGYVTSENGILSVETLSFPLGSTTIYNLVLGRIPGGLSDDKNEAKQQFLSALNVTIDSLKPEIRNSFENVQNAQNRNELYISGGAAYIITTLLYPEADQNQQMIELDLNKLKAFYTDIQDVEYYKKLSNRTFKNPKQEATYKKVLEIYNYRQLISATKLLLTYINALSAEDRKIYFNTWGLYAMPAALLGRMLRGEIPRW